VIAERFEIRVDDTVLDDLRSRLAATRLLHDYANDDWTYGVPRADLAELVDYWHDGFDWRAQERAINAYEHFRVTIEGVPIHFLHARGTGSEGGRAPIPIVLTHGWPWTFWDFARVIGPLTDPAAHGGDAADAFDVVVPSLPGFGFSSPLTVPGINFWRTADLWVTLMQDVLGYDRFAAHGGDWGALVTAQLGHKYADRLIGIHQTTPSGPGFYNVERPWSEALAGVVATRAGANRTAAIAWERDRAAHMATNNIDPQTVGYAFNDSPAGLAGWLLEKRHAWGDCRDGVWSAFTKDELLTNFTLFWVTQTIGTSARWYQEAGRNLWAPAHDRTPQVEAPTGISVMGPDMPPGSTFEWLPGVFNLQFFNQHDRGGHFAPMENPDAVIDDLRATFRPLRGQPPTTDTEEPHVPHSRRADQGVHRRHGPVL